MSRPRFPLARLVAGMAAAVALAVVAACGSGGPSAPAVTPSAAPTPTPTPVAQPTPTPEPSPTGEPPVTRTEPPVRITLRFYALEDPQGELVPDYRTNADGSPIVPVNYMFRIDAVAKDAKNKETMGDGNVRWTFSDENLIEIVRDTNPFQYRLRALRGGTETIYVTMTGGKNAHDVDSNPVTVEIR